MDKNPEVSIIIRAKNEEKWIASCLSSVFQQEFDNFEVILVDNNSTDRTVEKAKSFPVKKILSIDKFFPGKSLNLGIRHSTGRYLVFLSAHCIPVNKKWLGKLLSNFDNEKIAGVYGRQEPMAFTEDIDKRDLLNIFGLDKKVQKKDPFFHNANSVIRRDVWEKYPFSETTTNIEDRIWAIEVLKNGFNIVYEPDASVYHYHGINQGRNIERARNVVRIIEKLHGYVGGRFNVDEIEVVAIIPARKPVKYAGSIPLLELAVHSVQKACHVNRIIVATDNEEHYKLANKLGVEAILRPPELSRDYIELVKIYQFVLEELASSGLIPDLVVLAQEKFPFRPPLLVDTMIERLVNSDRDNVMAVTPVYRSLWKEEEDHLIRIDQGFVPSKFKEPLYMGLYGLGCVLESGLIMQGEKIGHRTGLVTVDNPYSTITASSNDELQMVASMLPQWYEYIKKDRETNT
jgi:glycosyltransferase involved in cell wall biosynthesis